MKKRILLWVILCASCARFFAGDVARFVDIGFSADGKTYFFGQYGKTDKKFLPYAEIFAVDVQKNDFIKTFKNQASVQTKSGAEVFEELKAANKNFLSIYSCSETRGAQILYLREDDDRSALNTIEFTDFVHSVRSDPVVYTIRLVPRAEGSGTNVSSSFYIVIERKNQTGAVIDRASAGNRDIKRAGVSGYRIEKIFTDSSGKNLVFIIEKTLVGEDGISVRYMVETAVLK
jgi:predicted secreted protein